jgi:hypothetical protein
MSLLFNTRSGLPIYTSSMLIRLLLCLSSLVCFAQTPNPETQREAMKKLAFLAGKWSGDATVQRGPGEPVKIRQSEDIQYRLGGLVMIIEGTGRDIESGKVLFNAFAVVNYDESKKQYRIRAYSDGRQVETELEVSDRGFAWGFPSGPAQIRNVMVVNEKNEWAETTTVKVGDRPEFTTVRMLLKHTSTE